MALDFGEVLARAWRITWGHKILWAFGFVAMLLNYLFLPMGFAPVFSILTSKNVPFWIEQPIYIFVYIALFFIVFLAAAIIGALAQAIISYGAWQAERADEGMTFGSTLKESMPLWGRFLGVTFLYMGGISMVVFAYFALQFLVTMLTFGLGAICMAPLQLLLYSFMFVTYAWFEQAQASIVVDGLGVFDAARRGWQVFRRNLLVVILMTLILYLGIGVLSGLASLPIMAPFFAIFFAGLEDLEAKRMIFILSALFMVVYLPILAAFQGVALTFLKSGWILTYLRLTRNTEEDIVASNA